MFTLGLHGGTNTASRWRLPTPRNWLHDAAAALCRDGEIVAAAEEERFARIKHVSHFPIEAIRYCLAEQGIGFGDVSRIVLSSEHMNEFLQLENRWRHGTRWWLESNAFVRFAARVLQDEFGACVDGRLLIAGHHRTHALSVIHHSGFADCLCIVLDGRGDRWTGLVASFEQNRLTILRTFEALGPAAMYLRCTEIIGFAQFDEYKVMGLASHGVHAGTDDDARRLVTLLSDGKFVISIPRLIRTAAAQNAFRHPSAPIEERHMRFAAAVQRASEQTVFHIVHHFKVATGHRHLCLAGGLAQNCMINGKLLASGLFDDVFVDPAAYDAGCAVGAAVHGYLEEGGRLSRTRVADVYWGIDTPDRRTLAAFLATWDRVVDVQLSEDICAATAPLLADGQIVGWFQGRAEFGARALGNRSILADPRPASNKDRINAVVKKREAFRPFAPSVLEEHLHDYFNVASTIRSLPFMTFVVNVKPCWRETLGAVTHIDGSARVQSVSRETNCRYWRLIRAFQYLTGVPLLLNTSFNSASEPIVNTPLDAMNCFLSTALDALVIGDFLIRRKFSVGDATLLSALVPRLAHRYALTQTADARGRRFPGIQDRYTNASISVSAAAQRCLASAIEEERSFGAVLAATPMPSDVTAGVFEELSNLWQQRVFVAARACAAIGGERVDERPSVPA